MPKLPAADAIQDQLRDATEYCVQSIPTADDFGRADSPKRRAYRVDGVVSAGAVPDAAARLQHRV
jgi:hypothetical protein